MVNYRNTTSTKGILAFSKTLPCFGLSKQGELLHDNIERASTTCKKFYVAACRNIGTSMLACFVGHVSFRGEPDRPLNHSLHRRETVPIKAHAALATGFCSIVMARGAPMRTSSFIRCQNSLLKVLEKRHDLELYCV